jgi:hypothetical protein
MLVLLLLSILMTISAANDPESFQWENRLIILFQLDENEAIRQLNEVYQDSSGYTDRDLKIIFLKTEIPDSKFSEGLENLLVTPENPQEWISYFRLEEIDTPMYILVGKDGGKKLNEVEMIPNDILFRVIDAMPMRQREMRKETERGSGILRKL